MHASGAVSLAQNWHPCTRHFFLLGMPIAWSVRSLSALACCHSHHMHHSHHHHQRMANNHGDCRNEVCPFQDSFCRCSDGSHPVPRTALGASALALRSHEKRTPPDKVCADVSTILVPLCRMWGSTHYLVAGDSASLHGESDSLRQPRRARPAKHAPANSPPRRGLSVRHRTDGMIVALHHWVTTKAAEAGP